MIDPKNVTNLTGGLVADPEFVGNNNNVIRFRVAVDYAGNDRNNPDNKSGYFQGIMFVNDDPNSSFVASQVRDGKMKRGSQVQLVARLQQQRYTTDDGRNTSSVELIIEALTYASSAPRNNDSSELVGAGASTSGGSKDADVPSEF